MSITIPSYPFDGSFGKCYGSHLPSALVERNFGKCAWGGQTRWPGGQIWQVGLAISPAQRLASGICIKTFL